MDITNKMLMDLAGQVGIDNAQGAGNAPSMADMQRVADRFQNADDAELIAEISKLKSVIKKDRKTYEQQLKAVQALRPMMNAEQRARLDKIIALLND